jgi:hypothetical protein
MSQGSLANPTTGTLSGLTDVSTVNGGLDALNTDNSGTSAPTNQASGSPSLGNKWLNTTSAIALRYVFDGTDWLYKDAIDTANHIFMSQIGGGAGTLASAATTDLGSIPQSVISITGTTTITSFGSSATIGSTKIVEFSSAGLLLTASSALLLPGGSNVTTQAGDYAICTLASAGVWLCNYFRANGQPLGFSNSAGLFGDGSDGNLTLSSGVVSLTRDMYYNNVTISGTGQIATNGFRVFVAGVLNLTAAGGGAIYSGPAGATAATAVTPAQSAPTSTDWGQTPGAGGNAANGHAALVSNILGGLGGAGGNGATTLNGAPQAGTPTNLPRLMIAAILAQIASLQPTGGGPGSGGGSATTAPGHWGGAGAYGGLPLLIFAATINRGSSTAANALQSYGGTGGVGVNIGASGSGGGGGGGGGPVIVIYGALIGSTATSALLSEGGPGGNGYNVANPGLGGQGGGSGPILLGNATSGVFSFTAGNAAGAAPSTYVGGSGAVTQMNL